VESFYIYSIRDLSPEGDFRIVQHPCEPIPQSLGGEMSAENTKMAACPECDDRINVQNDVELGQRIICGRCKSELVVIRTSPLELDWAFLEPFQNTEDWRKEKDVYGQ
jgi:lysine biosynthesis protein LysW